MQSRTKSRSTYVKDLKAMEMLISEEAIATYIAFVKLNFFDFNYFVPEDVKALFEPYLYLRKSGSIQDNTLPAAVELLIEPLKNFGKQFNLFKLQPQRTEQQITERSEKIKDIFFAFSKLTECKLIQKDSSKDKIASTIDTFLNLRTLELITAETKDEEIVSLMENLTKEQIRKAYIEAMRKHHSDKSKDSDDVITKKLGAARDALVATLKQPEQKSTPPSDLSSLEFKMKLEGELQKNLELIEEIKNHIKKNQALLELKKPLLLIQNTIEEKEATLRTFRREQENQLVEMGTSYQKNSAVHSQCIQSHKTDIDIAIKQTRRNKFIEEYDKRKKKDRLSFTYKHNPDTLSASEYISAIESHLPTDENVKKAWEIAKTITTSIYIDQLSNRVAEEEKKLATLTQEHESRVRELKNNLEKFSTEKKCEIERLNTEVRDLQKRITEFTTENDVKDQSIPELEEDIEKRGDNLQVYCTASQKIQTQLKELSHILPKEELKRNSADAKHTAAMPQNIELKEMNSENQTSLVNAFKMIYKGIRAGQSCFFKSDFLKINKNLDDKALIQAIRTHSLKEPKSRTAKAWELAQTHHNNCDRYNFELAQEMYTYALSHSGLFKKSKISGRIYLTAQGFKKSNTTFDTDKLRLALDRPGTRGCKIMESLASATPLTVWIKK